MKDLSSIRVAENIEQFVRDRGPDERYASFDYCFNYFQEFREEGRTQEILSRDHVEQSCFHLAFYLASWGMLRKSFLLDKSARYFRRVLEVIARCDSRLWEIDLPYADEDIAMLREIGGMLYKAMDNNPTDTLITKIMLGVFANVPALDRNVRVGFGVSYLDMAFLKQVSAFYESKRSEIDGYSPIYTLDFHTGRDTKRRYTKAKIVDMIGWVEGAKIEEMKRARSK